MSIKSVKSSTKISTIHFTIINIKNLLPNNCNSVIEENTTKPDYMCNVIYIKFWNFNRFSCKYYFETYYYKNRKIICNTK